MGPKYEIRSSYFYISIDLVNMDRDTYYSYQKFKIYLQHSADQFERLLKEMCADEDGDLLIESAVKSIPKVVVMSTLVSVTPAQPFVFRNYQVCLLLVCSSPIPIHD